MLKWNKTIMRPFRLNVFLSMRYRCILSNHIASRTESGLCSNYYFFLKPRNMIRFHIKIIGQEILPNDVISVFCNLLVRRAVTCWVSIWLSSAPCNAAIKMEKAISQGKWETCCRLRMCSPVSRRDKINSLRACMKFLFKKSLLFQ